VYQLIPADLFQQEPIGSGENGSEHGIVVGKRSQKQDPCVGPGCPDFATRFNPAAVRKPDIHQNHVRLQTRCLGHRAGHGSSLAGHVEAACFSEECPQAQPKHLVIVDEH
jgi:hypothetical protein